MMRAYQIWTWIAIALLAFGSIAVFVIFLVTTLQHLPGERNAGAKPRSQKKTPSP
jgi:uncharacterized protein YpmS